MKIEKGRGWARLVLEGDIDLAWLESHSADVEDSLQDNPALVIVDVEHVTFMDSSGLAILAKAYRECRQRDGEVCVIHPQPFVARTLGIAGLDQVVTVISDCREVREIYSRLAQLDVDADTTGSRHSLGNSASASA